MGTARSLPLGSILQGCGVEEEGFCGIMGRLFNGTVLLLFLSQGEWEQKGRNEWINKTRKRLSFWLSFKLSFGII